MNFMDVENPFGYLSYEEELMSAQVEDALDHIRTFYGYSLTKEEMDKVLQEFEIDYFSLPKYLQDKFDSFDIIL